MTLDVHAPSAQGRPDSRSRRRTPELTDEEAPTGSVSTLRAVEAPRPVAVHSVMVVHGSEGCSVSVELRRGDDRAVAAAEGVVAGAIGRRLVAETTLRAVASLEPAAAGVGLEAVSVAPLGDHAVATAVLVKAHPTTEEVLAGSAVVRASGEYDAVARAVLDGVGTLTG